MSKKHEEYLNSPYSILNIEERMFTTKENEELAINPETGEYFTMRKVAKDKKILHDSMVYTKLFAENVKTLMTLSPSAIKVLLYGMATVKPMSEVVVLNGPDVCVFCDISSSTFNNAIYELLNSKVLSKKLGSSIEFWFDPNVFFNGNRVKMIKR